MIPSDFVTREVLDDTVDSINVLGTKMSDANRRYSIRVFRQTDLSRELIDRIIKWNEGIKAHEAKFEHARDRTRFLTFETRFDPVERTFCAIRPFYQRTLEMVCFSEVKLFDDEKHAISFQLAEIGHLLASYPGRLPVFPSRIIFHGDLFLQLTDLYPPNPIDEEAFIMGWFEQQRTTEDFIVKIIQLLWEIDDEDEARQRLVDYQNFTENVPSWGRLFMEKHRKTSVTDGMPPLIALDINRAKLTEGLPFMMCHALGEIVGIIPKLDNEMIQRRLVRLITSLMHIEHDIIQSLVLLVLVAIVKKIGFGENDGYERKNVEQIYFQNYVDHIASSSHRVAARFVLYCIIPDVVRLLPTEEGKTLIRGLSLLAGKSAYELTIFLHKFTATMMALNEMAVETKSPPVKPFVCQMIESLPITEALLSSLITMPPSMYVVDALLVNMPFQLKSQVDIRYLLSIAKYASPAILFKFKVLHAANSRVTISSLAFLFLQRLKDLLHPVDYRLLVPGKVGGCLVDISRSPAPVSDNLLETVNGMIIRRVITDVPETMPVLSEKRTSRVSLSLGAVQDLDFTTDGKCLLTVSKTALKFYNSSAMATSFSSPKCDGRRLFDVELDCLVGMRDSVLVFGHVGRNTYIMEPNIDHVANSVEQTILADAGCVTVAESVGSPDFLLIGTDAGHIFVRNGRISKLFTINADLGAPVSISIIPQTSYYVVGSSTGNVMLYDLRMQCPVRRARPSNRPAFVSGYDPSSFWVTCGPYCTKMDMHMSTIERSVCAPPSHVLRCCCIRDCVVTAHSDHALLAFNGRRVIALDDPEFNVMFTDDRKTVMVNPRSVAPKHEAEIKVLKKSPVMAAPVSCDANGVVVLWQTPEM